MIERKRNKKKMTLTLLDAMISIVVLILSLQLIRVFTVFGTGESTDIADYNYSSKCGIAAMLWFILAAAEAIRALAARGGPKFPFIRRVLSAVLCFAGGVLIVVMRGNLVGSTAAGVCYGLTLVLGRIDAIRRDRRVRSIVTNALALLLIGLLLGTALGIFCAPIFMIIISFFHIGKVAFSQIDFRRMEKIIRKTFAVEIIFGMLLLILAFSAVMERTEDQMATYGDALWYCFALVTTIGFGDITATTLVGRILSVILGIYGIIVVSLITSVIVNFYNEVKDVPDDAPPPDDEAPDAPAEEQQAEEESP